MSLMGKHNRHKPASDDRHAFTLAAQTPTATHFVAETTIQTTPEHTYTKDQYNPESSSGSRPVVGRSQSTRNPSLYPNLLLDPPQHDSLENLKTHQRHSSQTSAEFKKGKRFFQRMLTSSSRPPSEAKPYPPSVHRNTASLVRRVSANDTLLSASALNSHGAGDEPRTELKSTSTRYSNSFFSTPQPQEFEGNLGPEEQYGLRKQLPIQAEQDDSQSPGYKAHVDEQRSQHQDLSPYNSLEASPFHLDQGFFSLPNVNFSQLSVATRESYRYQYSETASQFSLESTEDQRSLPGTDNFPNQNLYALIHQSQAARPELQFMAPPGGPTMSRRTTDQKLSLQVQQEARDGPSSSNFNRSTQAQAYRASSQRDQYGTQNEQSQSTPPSPAAERDLNDTYKELLTKYKKVKGLYFEKTAQVEQLQNTLANQRLSQSRTSLDDSEYMTRFQRLEGAVTNLAFNIRKDWRTVPYWLSKHVNRDALKIGKQEMTAVGRAVITKFLMDEIFNLTFHPSLPSELSSSLKVIEKNIRKFSPALNNQEESDALNAKVAQWRLTTLDGLKDTLALPESEENKKQFSHSASTKLSGFLIKFLQEPIPPGIEDSATMIVELAVGIASNLPLESREISIIHPMPGDTLQHSIMKLENLIPPLVDPGAETDDAESPTSADRDDNGKDKKGHGILQGMMSGNSSGKKENSDAKKMEDGAQKIRFSGFVGVEVRGRQVLFKAPVWTGSC